MTEPGLRRPPRLIVLGARVAMVAAVAAVVVKVGIDNASSLRHIHLRVAPAWFVPAAAASLIAGLCMPLGWRLLISAYGPLVARRATLRIWWTAQITRYVPTGAAALATRVVLAAREGVPRMLAGASLPIEVAIVVGCGTVLTGALLPDSVLPLPGRLAVAALGAGGLATLPVLLRLAGRWVPKMPSPRPGPEGTVPVYAAEAWYGVNSFLRSGAFLFLAAALLPVRWGDLALLAGAFNAGAVGGLVSIAPGGLGVREGILTLVLKGRYGFGDAAALSVALRGWDLVIDVVWLTAARVAGRRRPGPEEPAAMKDSD
ncbi:MAG TPA: hypothetical protein VNF50_13935 [Acidimicrobiales bacterium]|nr:hypothetical protein [Acidimicrobiales bacterium]